MDSILEKFGTEKQKEYLRAVEQYGSQNKAAKALGVARPVITRSIEALKKKARMAGYDPENDLIHPVGEGLKFKGSSTLYDENGEVKLQWVKTDAAQEKQHELFREFIEGLSEDIKGKAKPSKSEVKKHDPDLMSAIIIGDAHLGMYAWKDETLAMDFDTDIACRDIRAAVDNLVERAPNAETGVLIDVGDFMHMNTSSNQTAKGTMVDVDTRHARVLKMAGMVMRYCVDRMLKKFKKVVVVVAKGNHNPEPAMAVALMLQFYYDKEPRVEVMDTIGHFHYLTHGKWLIGVNHGDMVKSQKLVSVMARDHKGWSDAKFRLWIVGHVHHERAMEIDGCTVMSFNTLAPRDAWHAANGYGSRQSMTMITFHKTKGKHSTLEYDLPSHD